MKSFQNLIWVAGVERSEPPDATILGARKASTPTTHRKAAKDKFRFKAVRSDLEKPGVHILSAGADEVPGVYKNIDDVMREPSELVETIARFDSRIVKMCDDGRV